MAPLGDDLGPVAGQVQQPGDLPRRHEASPQQAALQQLGEPGRVRGVGLAPGQVLDVAGVDQHQLEPRPLQRVPPGFQKTPVASIATWDTSSATSHSRSR